jgi:phospholipase C
MVRSTYLAAALSSSCVPKVDKWGPGARVPTLIISPFAKKSFVDHTQMDTTSILALIEYQYDLKPLGDRDAKVANMTSVFDFTQTPSATMSATAAQ